MGSDIKIEDLPGVGKVTAARLREAGIFSVRQLAEYNADELAAVTGIEPDRAARIIHAAVEALKLVAPVKASQLYKTPQRRLLTHVAEFDKHTSGLIFGYIYEFAGEFGAGKSTLAHQVAVLAAAECEVVYIDTESAFNLTLIQALERRFSIQAADRITVYTPTTVTQLELVVRKLPAHLESACVIIVDTITALYRAEFVGRENLALRQQRLHYVVDLLRRHARTYNALVLLTNQVLDVPDIFASGKRPTGGNVLAHSVNFRFMMVRPNKAKPEGYIWPLDAPSLPPSLHMNYRLTEAGLE